MKKGWSDEGWEDYLFYFFDVIASKSLLFALCILK